MVRLINGLNPWFISQFSLEQTSEESTNLRIIVFAESDRLVIPVSFQRHEQLPHLLDSGRGTGTRMALGTADLDDNFHDAHSDARDESAQSRVPAVCDTFHFQVKPKHRIDHQVPYCHVLRHRSLSHAPINAWKTWKNPLEYRAETSMLSIDCLIVFTEIPSISHPLIAWLIERNADRVHQRLIDWLATAKSTLQTSNLALIFSPASYRVTSIIVRLPNSSILNRKSASCVAFSPLLGNKRSPEGPVHEIMSSRDPRPSTSQGKVTVAFNETVWELTLMPWILLVLVRAEGSRKQREEKRRHGVNLMGILQVRVLNGLLNPHAYLEGCCWKY